MAGSLVTEKFDVDVVMQCILQQIDYIAMVGYGTGDSSGTDAFLLPHAEKVQDGIRDPVLRKSHVMEE